MQSTQAPQTAMAPISPSVPLTPTQVQTMRAQIGVKPVSNPSTNSISSSASGNDDWSWLNQKTGQGSETTNTTQGPGYFGRVGQDYANTAQNIEQNLSTRSTDISQGQKPSLGHELESGFQTAGDVAGAVYSPIGEAPGVKQAMGGLNDIGAGIAGELMKNPAYSKMFQNIAGYLDKNPNVSHDIGSAYNLAMLAPIGEAGNEATNLATSGISKVPDIIGDAGDKGKQVLQQGAQVARSAVDLGNKAIAPVRQFITSLPAEVKNTIATSDNPGELKSQLQNALSTGRNSIKTGGEALSPYEQAGRDYLGKAMETLDNNLSRYGETARQALSSFGDKTVKVGDSLDKLRDLAQSRLGTVFHDQGFEHSDENDTFEQHIQKLNSALDGNGDSSVFEGLFGDAPGRNSLVTKASDKALLAKVYSKLTDLHENGTSVQKLRDVVDELDQDVDHQQSSRPKPTNTKTEGVVKMIVHDLRNKVSNMGTDENGNNAYSSAQKNYSRAIGLKNDLEKRLGGQVGQNGDYKNAASVLIRRLSPQDGGTRPILRALQEETGVPVFHHAIMAKFAMDVLKDNRVRSVLENMSKINGVTSAVGWLWKSVRSLATDPGGRALNLLEKQIGKKQAGDMRDAIQQALENNTENQSSE